MEGFDGMNSVTASKARTVFMDLMQNIMPTEMANFAVWLDFKLAEYKCKVQGDITEEESKSIMCPSWIGNSIQQQLAMALLGKDSFLSHTELNTDCDDVTNSEAKNGPLKRSSEESFSQQYDEYSISPSKMPKGNDVVYPKWEVLSNDSEDASQSRIAEVTQNDIFDSKEECDVEALQKPDGDQDIANVVGAFTDFIPPFSYANDVSSAQDLSKEQVANSTLFDSSCFSSEPALRCFKCPECSDSFTVTAELKQHIPLVHGHEVVLPDTCPGEPTGLASWSCYYCTKRATHFFNLWDHVLGKHCNARFFCKYCGKGMRYKQHLSKHYRDYHFIQSMRRQNSEKAVENN